MPESNFSEVASPAHGNADTEEGGADNVAEGLPQVEAFVGELPHTFQGLGVVGLTKNLLISDLMSKNE